MVQRLIVALGAVLATGCLTPRSMTLGQMASGVGRGATEVGVFTGVLYGVQTQPPTTVTDVGGNQLTLQDQARGVGLPSAEANLQYGFTDRVGLNVHASPAGLQPGAKFTLNKSKVANVALLPAIGFGYASVGQVTYQAGGDGRLTEVAPGSSTSFTFLGGLKFLVSHRSGFFAGVGYDFVFNRSYSATANSATSDRQEAVRVNLQHQLGASVGMSIAFGAVHLRPELAFAIVPSITQTLTSTVGSVSNSATVGGGFAWAIFPGFSLAVATPARPKTEAEEEEEERERRRAAGEEDDDEDEQPRKKARPHPDDEDDDRPKKRRPSEDDEDEDEKPKRRKASDEDE